MEYLTVAYVLIAGVLITYTVSLRQRLQGVKRERELLQSKED